jgi:hypothetical protein
MASLDIRKEAAGGQGRVHFSPEYPTAVGCGESGVRNAGSHSGPDLPAAAFFAYFDANIYGVTVCVNCPRLLSGIVSFWRFLAGSKLTY